MDFIISCWVVGWIVYVFGCLEGFESDNMCVVYAPARPSQTHIWVCVRAQYCVVYDGIFFYLSSRWLLIRTPASLPLIHLLSPYKFETYIRWKREATYFISNKIRLIKVRKLNLFGPFSNRSKWKNFRFSALLLSVFVRINEPELKYVSSPMKQIQNPLKWSALLSLELSKSIALQNTIAVPSFQHAE